MASLGIMGEQLKPSNSSIASERYGIEGLNRDPQLGHLNAEKFYAIIGQWMSIYCNVDGCAEKNSVTEMTRLSESLAPS